MTEDTPRLDILSLLAEAQAECDRLQAHLRGVLTIIERQHLALTAAYGLLPDIRSDWGPHTPPASLEAVRLARSVIAEALPTSDAAYRSGPAADAGAAVRESYGAAADSASDARRP